MRRSGPIDPTSVINGDADESFQRDMRNLQEQSNEELSEISEVQVIPSPARIARCKPIFGA
jgi:hypothetical protein